MEKYQIFVISLFLIGSVLCWLIPLMRLIVGKLTALRSGSRQLGTGLNGILLFSAFLIGAVWCLRFAVGYYKGFYPDEGTVPLEWWEELFNSLVHALQTFSMDEDYTQYITDGKAMLFAMCGKNTGWQQVYGIYAAILNFIAPIAGGAIIFEILAGVFPQIKLRLSFLASWREKYYFSELNEASLALAKSICKLDCPWLRRPVIIFTDVYTDDENEKQTEMLLEAKRIGAICVRDDLAHIPKNRRGERKLFLIDGVGNRNLQIMTGLAGESDVAYLKNAQIFLFTNDDAYVQVEKQVRKKLEEEAGFSEEELPVFLPVQSNRNLITKLLVDIPLYEPLIGKKKNEDGQLELTVTVLGSGGIGTEMFLSTYWFGQILNCNLNINVVSKETEEEFWNRIDCVNPEIRYTTMAGHSVLRVNSNGDMASVYANVHYIQCDVRSTKFVEAMTGAGKQDLRKTDYFFVALGDDDVNTSAANMIRRYVGQHHIETQSTDRTVITYVVYASDLAQALNRCRHYCSCVKGRADVYMCAVGSLEQVYSVRNVFLMEHKDQAQETNANHAAIQSHEKVKEKQNERIKDEYKYWASMARSMHRSYKAFSSGMLNVSLFDDHTAQGRDYVKARAEALDRYKKWVLEQDKSDSLQLLHELSWLEHRRWCAFTRVKGFRYTDKYDVYSNVTGGYKQMDLKLHPCLVECDRQGICASLDSKGRPILQSLFKCTDHSRMDRLDELTYDLKKKGYIDYDFKQSDYPFDDFS